MKVIRPSGIVEFVAGTGMDSFADGLVDQSSFDFLNYICVDSNQDLFIADNNNNRIRKVDISEGIVSTFAGNDQQGHKDGGGENAIFFLPQGIAIDANDNLFIGDRNNNRIRKITPDRQVTTYAGIASAGHNNGPSETARFNGPKGLSVDANGNVYVADRLNFVVRKIDTFGIVTAIAGFPSISGYNDGLIEDEATIGRAVDVIPYKNGFLISDWGNNVIRILDSGVITSSIDFEINSTITIAPNPSHDLFFIQGDLGKDFVTKVFNTQGQLITSSRNNSVLDTEEMSSGIYFLQIKGETYLNIHQIIKN